MPRRTNQRVVYLTEKEAAQYWEKYYKDQNQKAITDKQLAIKKLEMAEAKAENAKDWYDDAVSEK